MRHRRTIWTIPVLIFAWVVQSQAQIFPELNFPLSAETNAMGGAGVSYVSDNAMATNANPAELGISSLKGITSVAFIPGISVSPNFDYPLHYFIKPSNAFAVNLGLPLDRFWHNLPMKLSMGLGYSYGWYKFGITSTSPYNSAQTDFLNSITIGIGLRYLATLSLGYTLRPINSTTELLPGTISTHQTASSHDFGAILQVPLAKVVSKLSHHTDFILGDAKPVVNLTFGYTERNAGGYSSLGGDLPREGDLGLNLEVGFKSQVDRHEWEWFSISLTREADVSLVSLDSSIYIYPGSSDTTYNYFNNYVNGLGNFQCYDNFIAGRPTGNVGVLNGWQVQLGQFLYLRGGSTTEPGIPTYTTLGWGARLDGLLKTLIFIHWLTADNKIAELLLSHFDFQFDYSRATGGPFQDESFETLNLVVR